MKNEDKLRIFLVDDDVVFLKSLETDFLENTPYAISTFATGELCLSQLFEKPDLVILDYQLDGIDKTAITGVETLDQIKAYNREIPVIILSGQDKIDVAVDCMHHRAFDYIVKSETAFLRIQRDITEISRIRKLEKQLKWYMDRM